jgi:hypothetical protein
MLVFFFINCRKDALMYFERERKRRKERERERESLIYSLLHSELLIFGLKFLFTFIAFWL